ncbi:unnamed protein product [Mytilus coruscus]|uniref:Reverse transcriptase domain-containing protein n=1 Tax=Mytilus coruscus TaxID=42192 RepID=A0A6J8DI43_MYTCO|nr:unnamed protein product [Mytilus coruscus]
MLAAFGYCGLSYFESVDSGNDIQYDVTTLNDPISREEIIKAVESAKVRKATGFDEIPAEVLKNPTAVEHLFVIYNGCFEFGKVPKQWTTGIINPIFKTGSDDRKNPLNYRGITLVSVPSKIYCHVLNSRLNEWTEANKTICDEQNGFREREVAKSIYIRYILSSMIERYRNFLILCAS